MAKEYALAMQTVKVRISRSNSFTLEHDDTDLAIDKTNSGDLATPTPGEGRCMSIRELGRLN